MNANQVVIVMDREKADRLIERRGYWATEFGLMNSLEADLRAALDRDPDLETLIAKAIEPSVFRDDLTWSHSNMPEAGRQLARSQARAVLHALQEGTENE